MRFQLRRFLNGPAAAALLALAFAKLLAEDWPQFRGPGGEGHSSETEVPLAWSDSQNVAWKRPIPGLGWSSPVVGEGRVWLTSALDEGRSLRALAIDCATGEMLYDVEVFKKENPGPIHAKNSHASPTPVLEKDRLYVHFGAHGTACLSADGKVLWATALNYEHRHGPAGSPVLYEDLLILSCDGTDSQYVIALDKATGKTRWKADRQGPMAYSTPLLLRAGGREQLVSSGGNQVVSYEPRTGAEIWRFQYEGFSVVPRPVFGQGLVFICSGYNSPSLYAIKPDGQGEVTATHLAWKTSRRVPHNPSPLLAGEELYLVSDNGIATCLEAKTGKEIWQQRLGGNFSASPLYAAGRIYFLSEEGEATILAAGREFKKLAVNQVTGRTLASPAISEKSIYLRTDTHLFRIKN